MLTHLSVIKILSSSSIFSVACEQKKQAHTQMLKTSLSKSSHAYVNTIGELIMRKEEYTIFDDGKDEITENTHFEIFLLAIKTRI